MTLYAALSAGFLVGLSIAMPVGPMSLLCIQRTLSFGMGVGVSTGLGAVTINIAYATLILIGLDEAGPWLESGRRVLTALGGAFLLWVALRTMLADRLSGRRSDAAPPTMLSAYSSAAMFNATNPLGPILILACLTPIIGRDPPPLSDAVALLAGMSVAATAWWVCLAGAVSLLRSRLNPVVLLLVNRVAGVLLTLYGALALARSIAP